MTDYTQSTLDGAPATARQMQQAAVAALGLGPDEAHNENEVVRLLVRRGGPARHERRVTAAREALLDLAWENVDDRAVGPLGEACEATALAWLYGKLDAVGVGGPEGINGSATARFPGLEALGKGRKHASDGAAWSAAIDAAADRLQYELRPAAEDNLGESWLGLVVRPHDGGMDILLDLPWAHEGPHILVAHAALTGPQVEWGLALAKRAALARMEGQDMVKCVCLLGSARDWALLAQALRDRLDVLQASSNVHGHATPRDRESAASLAASLPNGERLLWAWDPTTDWLAWGERGCQVWEQAPGAWVWQAHGQASETYSSEEEARAAATLWQQGTREPQECPAGVWTAED